MTTSAFVEHRGCKLAYDIRGDGPPVLLIQGVGVHGDGWLPQIDVLKARYTCLSFDNRGMGRSQPLGEPLTVDGMAADALAVMDACGWDSAHIVGHSLGGLIAEHIALTARARVRSLALLCTFARGSVPTRLSPWMLWVGTRTRIGTKRMRRRAFLQLVTAPDELARVDADALAAKLAPLFGHDLADQPPIAMKQLGAMRGYDARPHLGEITGVPTLVVSARFDPIAPPEAGREIADRIPGATYVEIPDASHGLPIQHADRVNALLAEHFARADGR